MAEYRFEIWSILPGENPMEDSDWDGQEPFKMGELTHDYNISIYTIMASSDKSATLFGRGMAFSDGWCNTDTASRLFYLDKGKWVRV